MTNVKEVERKRQQDEIKSHCNRLLKTAEVKNVYPTPIDTIVEAAELVRSGDLTLLEINENALPKQLWHKFKNSLSELVSIVRAGLFPKEKTIFINPNAPASSIPFVTLHECVHNILPWQKNTFIYLDDEKTLDPEVRFQFEREANFGASYLLWQGEDYINKLLDMPVCATTPVSLAKLFGGSIHSSMRYYVENHRAPLGLLVFQCNKNDGLGHPLNRYKFHYFTTSENFKSHFGSQKIPFNETHINTLLTLDRSVDLCWNGEIMLNINNTSILFEYSGYETPYNVFIILAQNKIPRRSSKPIIVVQDPTQNH